MSNPALQHLEAAVRHDLELLDYPRREWVLPRHTKDGARVLDCLIIGGGQGGLAVAWGLKRDKVTNVLVVDTNPEGSEGPWRTFGRMVTLRTPKYVTGPDGGVPSLTIRAWYEAQNGPGAWDKLDLIPKEMWADYLLWMRKTLALPVRNQTRAGAIEWREDEQCFAVPLLPTDAPDDARGEIVYARTVVLATGIEGSGSWHTPPMVRDNLPPHLHAHTHTEIAFKNFEGKRVGVLGAGACAFDNASVALEHGAKEVHLFFRRHEMVRVNPYRWAEFAGFLKHHADLPDADKWKFIAQIVRMGQLPPANTFKRATRFDNFFMHPDSPWTSVQAIHTDNDAGQEARAVGAPHQGARITTPHQQFDCDFIITGTGFQTDLSIRPELKNIFQDIALWRDKYTPPQDQQNAELGRHPYLGATFEFTPKTPGTAPYLNKVFNYTFGCLLSMGFGGASISGMKYSVRRVVNGITKHLYVDDRDAYFESLKAYDVPDFEP